MNHPKRGFVKDWPTYIRRFLAKHGMSQAELGRRLRVSRRNIDNWLAGISTPPEYLKRALRDVERELTAQAPAAPVSSPAIPPSRPQCR